MLESMTDIINQKNRYKLVIYFGIADLDLHKLNDIVLDGEDLDSISSDNHPENGVTLRTALRSADRNGNEGVDTCSPPNFSMVLKKVLKDYQEQPDINIFLDFVSFSFGRFFVLLILFFVFCFHS